MYIRKLFVNGLAASLLLVGTAIAADGPDRSSEQATSDASMATKIKSALISNEATKARQIDVEVYKGQVQLNGFVDTAEQMAAAGRVAAQIAGEKNVKNNLALQQGERTAGQVVDDGMITAKVKAALIGDSRTKAHQIEVKTREGIVQLGGFVDSPTAKAAASEVAESVSGVKTVQNQLSIRN